VSDLAKLVDWLRRLEAVADAVRSWRSSCLQPFSNRLGLGILESVIGQNLVEILGRPE